MKKLLLLFLSLSFGVNSQANFRDKLPFTKKEIAGCALFTGAVYGVNYLQLNRFVSFGLYAGLSFIWIDYMSYLNSQTKTTPVSETEAVETPEEIRTPEAFQSLPLELDYATLQKILTDLSFAKKYLTNDEFKIECPVCLDTEDPLNEKDVAILPCGHILCAQCFNDMKTINATFDCPECRQPVSSYKTAHEYINDCWAAKLIEDGFIPEQDPALLAPPAQSFYMPTPSAPPAQNYNPAPSAPPAEEVY